MKTKDLLLLAGGLALGYLASKMNWLSKSKMKVEELATTATDLTKDAEKIKACEQKWNDEVASLTRFKSQEAMEESKNSYVKDCISK